MRVRELIKSIRKAVSEVWSYGLGKVGLILLVLVIGVSIYALITMPPNFVAKWNNPLAWKLYPRFAPPAWLRFFGAQLAPHKVVVVEGSDYTLKQSFAGVNVVYETTYVLDVNDFPQDLHAVISLSSTLTNRTVLVRLVVDRPDNISLVVAEKSVQLVNGTMDIAADPNMVASKYYLVFSRYNLSLAQWVKLKDLISLNYAKAIFGIPSNVSESSLTFAPLKGTYRIRLVVVLTKREVHRLQMLMPINYVKFVIVGDCYGILGTDNVGHDLFLGVLYGFPVALLVGFFAAVTATFIGMFIGAISGYYGGALDEFIQRCIDVLSNVPLLPILILIGAIVQKTIGSPWMRLFVIIGFLILFSWGGVAIIVRSMTLSIKAEAYIEAARAIGASNIRILFKHVVPQVIPYTFAVLVFSVPGAILVEAGLSVLGIRHGLPTWGAILADARDHLGIAMSMWWWWLPPGLMLAITSFTFVALGITLETIVEPRLRRA